MKEMSKTSGKVYLTLAAVFFYAAGIITFLTDNQSSSAIGWMFIVLGSMQLTLIAALNTKKS